jgi:membrane protein
MAAGSTARKGAARVRSGVGGRIGAIQHWLERRADTKVGRLSLQWFRAYFAASQNSGSAATLYSFLSVAPVVLAVIGLLKASGADTNTFADHLVTHLGLSGTTAELVKDTFGSVSSNALAASLAAVVGFLVWGLGLGPIYQNIYSRAWGVQVGSPADQARFAIWFFVASGAVGAYIVLAEHFSNVGWIVLIPGWIAVSTAFWLWTPRFFLHKTVSWGHLVPGALLASITIGGATATSPLFLGGWLYTDGKYFGSFGVVMGLIGWAFVLVTMSMACIVFSPVWWEWRRGERERATAPASG